MVIFPKIINKIKDIGLNASEEADKLKINYGQIHF